LELEQLQKTLDAVKDMTDEEAAMHAEYSAFYDCEQLAIEICFATAEGVAAFSSLEECMTDLQRARPRGPVLDFSAYVAQHTGVLQQHQLQLEARRDEFTGKKTSALRQLQEWHDAQMSRQAHDKTATEQDMVHMIQRQLTSLRTDVAGLEVSR